MMASYPTWFVRKRYLITILTFFGMCLTYVLRTNLSIAIVDMTSNKNITIGNTTYLEKAEFDWSSTEKGFLLSLFSYGYLLAPLGGIMSIRFGGATMFGLGIALTALMALLSPVCVRFNFYVFSAARILEGVLEGFITPAYVTLFLFWAPPNERTRLMMYANVGCFFGAIVNYPFCGYAAEAFGWEAIFYTSGGLSLLWYILWLLLVSNSPQEDKFISIEEKSYLKEKINYVSSNEKVNLIYPWKDIFTSGPIWAYLNDCFVQGWSYSFVVYCLPIYIKDVYDVNITDIGLISSIPGYFSIISELIAASLADYLRSNNILSISNVHKSYILFGQISAIVILITTATWTNFIGSIACFSILRFCFCFAETSYEVLPVDMAAEYSSLVYGLGTSTFSFGCLLSPTLMGYIVSHKSRAEWNKYFTFLSLFNVWGAVIYWVYGSGEVQPWAIRKEVEIEKDKRAS